MEFLIHIHIHIQCLFVCFFVSSQFVAPSPRQRCRIKTNPWLSTPETSAALANGNSITKKMDIDTSSTSSGIKSSSDAGTDDKKRYFLSTDLI